jgi:hypothetical protein
MGMLLNSIRQRGRWLVLLALGLGLGGAVGAVSACHTDAADCSSVCNRYRECVDQNFDVSDCESRCVNKAGKDRDFDDRLTHCQSCTEGRTCSETVSNCVAPCAVLVL